AWFEPDEARQRVKASQIPLIDRLEAVLAGNDAEGYGPAAATIVTRTSVGFAPDATSEPPSGVTTSRSRRYEPGAVGAVTASSASNDLPGASPIGMSVLTAWAAGSVGRTAPSASGIQGTVRL